jgi:hypothetical protein
MAVGVAVMLLSLTSCSYPYDEYENYSSYNGHFICPKDRLSELFSSLERQPREGRFATARSAPNAGNSVTFEHSATVNVIVFGEDVDLAVFNHRSREDDQHVPADILPLLRSYEAALIRFGCRKGKVTFGTKRSAG